MSITDWHEMEQRRLTYEWIATQTAYTEWNERRTRRHERIRRCARWLNPFRQIVSDIGGRT